jgi:hypothetical protein
MQKFFCMCRVLVIIFYLDVFFESNKKSAEDFFKLISMTSWALLIYCVVSSTMLNISGGILKKYLAKILWILSGVLSVATFIVAN